MIPVDCKLTRDQRGLFDISIGANGDFETTQGMDTSLVMALGCERRADASEVLKASQRRGWWGNSLDTSGFEIGSKLWLLDQARLNQNTMNRAIDYAKRALDWLTEDGYATSVGVRARFLSQGVELIIDTKRSNSPAESLAYELWENTNGV